MVALKNLKGDGLRAFRLALLFELFTLSERSESKWG